MRRAVTGSVAALLLAMAASAENLCANLPPPSVTTLMVSKTDPTTAWVVRPDCEGTVFTLEEDNTKQALNCSANGIKRIESVPLGAQRLFLENNNVQGADFSKYNNLTHIVLASNKLTSLDKFTFPKDLEVLDIDGNLVQAIPAGKIPDTVVALFLGNNSLESIDDIVLPRSLLYLILYVNKFTSINFPLPDGLEGVDLSWNDIPAIENITMPSTLLELTCTDCGVKSIRGVEFSSVFTTLALGDQVTLEELEIRASDLDTLKKLKECPKTVSGSKCKDSTADEVTLDNGCTVCVISDELFVAKYKQIIINPPPTSGSGSATSPSPGSGTNSPAPETDASESPSPSQSTESESSGSSSTVVIIIAVATSVIGIAVVAIAIRLFCYRRRSHDEDVNTVYKYAVAVDEPSHEANGKTVMSTDSSHSNEYLRNDIRNDEAMIAYRIDRGEIQIVRQIAKGGFGVIYLGRLRGRDVAVKKLLPDRAHDPRMIKSFMDEIRLCSQLDHPKIVAFVGVSWTSLADMAAVIEYMEGGDLGLLLQEQPAGLPPQHWFEASESLKPKCLLALDVIEALVYLHSFTTPIIHRDLKAKNVLLNGDGDAKLSDFGISREMSMDETMTGEVGTIAWIAPEVLQGERYSWKADIYSFGVLLVELDTCRHPYMSELRKNPSPQTNTRIAMMVSSGELTPSLSRQCPDAVRELAKRCLRHYPGDRPTAVEVHYELRKIMQDGLKTGERYSST